VTDAMLFAARNACRSMRTAGIYRDEKKDGGRWQLAQALRWAAVGDIFNKKQRMWLPCPSGFAGFGFTGGRPDTVLQFLLTKYAAARWPLHGNV